MLLRCCLIHITSIILRYILYLVYVCLCLGVDLFMSYVCDLLFIFSLIFVAINQTHMSFAYFSEYLLLFLDDNVDGEGEYSPVPNNSPPSRAFYFLDFLWDHPFLIWTPLLINFLDFILQIFQR